MEAQKCEADFESTSEFGLWSAVVPNEYKVSLHGMSVIRNAAFFIFPTNSTKLFIQTWQLIELNGNLIFYLFIQVTALSFICLSRFAVFVCLCVQSILTKYLQPVFTVSLFSVCSIQSLFARY